MHQVQESDQSEARDEPTGDETFSQTGSPHDSFYLLTDGTHSEEKKQHSLLMGRHEILENLKDFFLISFVARRTGDNDVFFRNQDGK